MQYSHNPATGITCVVDTACYSLLFPPFQYHNFLQLLTSQTTLQSKKL